MKFLIKFVHNFVDDIYRQMGGQTSPPYNVFILCTLREEYIKMKTYQVTGRPERIRILFCTTHSKLIMPILKRLMIIFQYFLLNGEGVCNTCC